jgi:uncharacterized coiled-coil protein SlyX
MSKDLEERVESLEDDAVRPQAIEGWLNTLNLRLSAMEEELQKLGERLDRLESA